MKFNMEDLIRKEVKSSISHELKQHPERLGGIKTRAPKPPTEKGKEKNHSVVTYREETDIGQNPATTEETRNTVSEAHQTHEVAAEIDGSETDPRNQPTANGNIEEGTDEDPDNWTEVRRRRTKRPRENSRIIGTREPGNTNLRAGDQTA